MFSNCDQLRFVPLVAIMSAALVSPATTARAVVIDDFRVGPITVVGPATQTQNDLDPAHVLGGSRDFNVGEFGSGSVLVITPADGMDFHSTGSGYFEIKYDLSAGGDGTDLTIGGHDRFRLEFGQVATATFTPLSVYFTLPSHSSSNGVSLYLATSDDLILEFPYHLFPTPPNNAQNLTLDVFRNNPGASLELKSITTAGPPLPGDYNRDGTVDGGDYDVWRSFLNFSTRTNSKYPIASADGNGDGRVDVADYTIWRKHIGTGSTSLGTGLTVIPEPATLWLLSFAFWSGLQFRRR